MYDYNIRMKNILKIIESFLNISKINFYADKIFVFIFIILIIIPVLNINLKKYSKVEKRKLAEFNSISDLEPWINDRFYPRLKLINFNHTLFYYTNIRYPHYNKRVIDKKTKELFRYPQPPSYQKKFGEQKYQEFVESIKTSLIKFNSFCEENNIKLYVLILPEKESVDHPSIIMNNNDKDIKDYIDDISNLEQLKVIFPLSDLQEKSKNEYMYFKTDHHLTNYGYYIALEKLIQTIQKDFPEIKLAPLSEFSISYNNKINPGENSIFSNGSNCATVGLPEYICNNIIDTKYKYYEHKDSKNLHKKKLYNQYLRFQYFDYPKGSDLKLLLIGNSHIEGMSLFLPYSFQHTLKIRLNGPPKIEPENQYKIIKNYKDEILKFKPNIIVICIGYDNVKRLTTLNDL